MPDKSARASGRTLRSEWTTFAWCFVVASILWLFTALNEQYTSSITVGAKYIGYPTKKVFLQPLPEDFKVVITAKGWDLMSNYFRREAESITIDLNDYNKSDELITRTLQDKFALLMSQKITVGEVFPELISLVKDEKGAKKVPVRLIQDISYKDQYGLGGEITYTPDSVVVTGPASIVKKIGHIDTEDETLKNLDKSTNREIKLKEPDPKNLSYNPDQISVNIPVYQLTEKKINISVQVINQSMSDTLKLIPDHVTIIYQAPVNKFSQIDSTAFQAIVDGSQVDTTNREPLKIQLITQPKFVYNVRLSPDYVNFLIRK